MPGPADLMALLQQGGGGGSQGGPPMPPGGGGMPPPGVAPGGTPMPPGAGGMGGMIQQVLGNLMKDPVAMKGMMQFLQQQGGGMGAPGNAQAPPPQGPQGSIPPGVPPMDAPAGAPMEPGSEQDMVSKEIDRKGATFDGTDAPTQNDIERLVDDPSAVNIKAFDAQFGQGAAEQILEKEGGGGGSEEQSEPQGGPPDQESGE
jgi:hypothetical protein